MFGGSSSSNTTLDTGDKNYQQAGNQGLNLAGMDVRRNSSVNATDNSGNQGFVVGNITAQRNSTTNVNLTQTDHGAVAGGLALGSQALTEMSDFGSEALFSMQMLAQQQQAASRDQVSEIGRLAETFRSDGASTTQRNMLYLGGGLLVFSAVAIIAVTWKGKK